MGWFARSVLWAYSGRRKYSEDPRFLLLSIPKHATPAFPPCFISSGNADPFAPQAAALATQLEKLGVRTDTLFFPANRTPALPHEYQFHFEDPAGMETLQRELAFVEGILRERAARTPLGSEPGFSARRTTPGAAR
jgi:acetyl esterase/lipase